MTAERAVRVAFIGGQERVGSTLISRVIGAVPGCCSVGELSRLWDEGALFNERCGCGARFRTCEFWQSVGERAFGGWDRLNALDVVALRDRTARSRYLPLLNASRLAPALHRRADRYAALLGAVYPAIRAVSGCDVVVDASKAPGAAYIAGKAPGVDVRMIHLIRSSRGVCYSLTERVPGGAGDAAPGQATLRAALGWTGLNFTLEMLGLLGMPTTLLRYEDFIGEPRGELERVLAFLGHRVRPGDLEFLSERSVELPRDHSVAGNRMRFRSGREILSVDEEFRTGLSRRAAWLITALTAPGLARYGYPVFGEDR